MTSKRSQEAALIPSPNFVTLVPRSKSPSDAPSRKLKEIWQQLGFKNELEMHRAIGLARDPQT